MAVNAIFVLCAAALLVQFISACPSGCGGGLRQAYSGLSTSGGNLPVSTYSLIAPTGISVESVNKIGGNLNVCGALPLLASVAFEGQLPSAGSAGVSYSCGDNVAITSASSGSGSRGLGSSCGRCGGC